MSNMKNNEKTDRIAKQIYQWSLVDSEGVEGVECVDISTHVTCPSPLTVESSGRQGL